MDGIISILQVTKQGFEELTEALQREHGTARLELSPQVPWLQSS